VDHGIVHDRERGHGSGRPLPRWHGTVGHTADVGLRATAPDGRALFEEIAEALMELSADVANGDELRSDPIELHAHDLAELAFAWLNELIGLGEIRGEALSRVEVSTVESDATGWVLRARAWFTPFDAVGVRPRVQVKAVTMHRLHVTRGSEGWALEAYLDV
jgi:SHS2 domain-containing protein